MNLSLYRKYRPKTFDEIYGQKHVKKYFENAILKNEISHAYIFNGPRGTGKTSVARILAKVLNCENLEEYNPCNKCSHCVSINEGSYMDVIELDAASNRGIDEIRQIRDSANYRPVSGKYKVYIIDEFHMLTREAFNALLKTLEEPPEHVIFILATTNLEKVPETIISRSQLINFKNIGYEDIKNMIKYVSNSESIEIEESAINIISKKAKGGMRDALSLLEQVMKFSDNKITLEDTINVLGLFDETFVLDFVNAIYSGNIDKILEISESLFSMGKEPEILLEQSIELIFETIKENLKMIKIMEKLSEILKEIKFNENKRLMFDVSVLALTYKYVKKEDNALKELEKDFLNPQNEEGLISSILKYYTEGQKENLAIYYVIKSSQIKESEGKIEFIFDYNKKLEYDMFHKYENEIKITISLFSNDTVDVIATYKGNNEKKESLNSIFN
ncbi:DNA polymerase III subunit gamma/tau [Tepiditoga spiralis]|uniref:DNA polymerase III subunit gamma/tau n=1 Tax=Tepiditoga spiralis TaxID=2108365 RepID=A0A7G1G4L8_9BACT|nr:DNA polymerase III subunit gamma/tau [Tepiditoga spiralis]BBE31321.1 DNA polymerase III subunit gamma/tau [Tepiditoga spiralis]